MWEINWRGNNCYCATSMNMLLVRTMMMMQHAYALGEVGDDDANLKLSGDTNELLKVKLARGNIFVRTDRSDDVDGIRF